MIGLCYYPLYTHILICSGVGVRCTGGKEMGGYVFDQILLNDIASQFYKCKTTS